MKKRNLLLIVLSTCLTLSYGMEAGATDTVPYETYTYTYEGETIPSPHAMTPDCLLAGSDYGIGDFKEPNDIYIDNNGYMYVADTGNNRIVILDENNRYVRQITDGLATPNGVFVTEDGSLYVADTGNKRILEFSTKDYSLIREIASPDEEDLPADFNYTPMAVAVNKAGKIYVLSTGSTYGIVALNSNGEFESFVGAQTVVPNLAERFWRLFKTDEQKRRTVKSIPANYSNLAIDDTGFLYLTSIPTDEVTTASAIANRSTDSNYAILKKLNYNGDDVLNRYGAFSPSGDVEIVFTASSDTEDPEYGISYVVDIALKENECYAMGDKKRNKVFVYDSDGNLLYAFGGTGYQKGQFVQISSLSYRGEELYVCDKITGKITRFVPTEYGSLITAAINHTSAREYDEAVNVWESVLKMNSGFDIAYRGIADSLVKNGDYTEAMEYYKAANDVSDYSKAYSKYRKELVGNYIMLVPVLIVAIYVALTQFFKFTRKYNSSHHPIKGNYGWRSEVVYAFHVIFHPMDGFWDLKNEKRGGVKGAVTILLFFIISMIAQQLGFGYIFNSNYGKELNIFLYIVVILAIVALWCVANWCLTSLMDGKGKLKEIFMASCYALLPMGLMNIPAIMLSNMLTENEGIFVQVFLVVGALWVAFLLIAAMMNIHEYPLGRNLAIIAGTIVAMLVIAFILLLFGNLLGRIYTFIQNIYNEVSLRL